ncbi:hypothetical protein E5D57_005604 [Metarhizium anisopliae]|nr:hypothetical protein E5D57_005604 [Metarhizium anisopliae]
MTRRCSFRIGSQLPYHRNQVENFKCSAGKSTAFARLRDGFQNANAVARDKDARKAVAEQPPN